MRDPVKAVPAFASITIITFRSYWHVPAARRRWARLRRDLLADGEQVTSYAVAEPRRRRITLVTLAGDEETLRRAAAGDDHLRMVRWTIERRTALWSAVYALSGWSSMSGPTTGSWSVRGLQAGGPG